MKLSSAVISWVLLALSPLGHAAEVPLSECEEAGARLTSLAGPIEKNARSFYEGSVQVLKYDTEEPACCSVGVAVTYPDISADEPPLMRCVAIHGFSDANVYKAKSVYVPGKGLVVTIATRDYTGSGSKPGKPLVLTIDLASGGKVSARR
jgi:hypothetical protein